MRFRFLDFFGSESEEKFEGVLGRGYFFAGPEFGGIPFWNSIESILGNSGN